jgi:hypothetical protein
MEVDKNDLCLKCQQNKKSRKIKQNLARPRKEILLLITNTIGVIVAFKRS